MDSSGGCSSRDDRTAKYQYTDSPCHGKYSVAGWLFRLVTVRQYNYSDENHDAEVELAQINYGEDAGEGASVGEVAATPKGTAAGSVEGVGQEAAVANLSEDGVEAVNQDMEATVEELIRQFGGYLIRGRIPWSACVPGGRYGQ